MRDAAVYLVIWLAGLFGLIGLVFAAVARLVRKDTVDHDRRFLWHIYKRGEGEERNKE